MDDDPNLPRLSDVEGEPKGVQESRRRLETGAFTKPLDLPAILGTLVQAGVLPPRKPTAAVPKEVPVKVSPSSRRRILVVDDEPAFREMLVEYLQGKGFEALGAGGGQEALSRIPEFHPHVVLLDSSSRMPRAKLFVDSWR